MDDLVETKFVDDVSATWERDSKGDVVWKVGLDLSDYDVSLNSGSREFTTIELLDRQNVHGWFIGVGLRQPDYSLQNHIDFVGLVFNKSKIGRGIPEETLPSKPPKLPELRAAHTLFDPIYALELESTETTHILIPNSQKYSPHPETVQWLPICGAHPDSANIESCDMFPNNARNLGQFVEEKSICTNCQEYLLWHLYFAHTT